MFCRNCGSQIGDGAGFCPNCGAQVAQPSGRPSPVGAAAGQPYPAGAAAAVSNARARRAKSGRNVKIAVIVAIVAAAVAVIALVVVPRLIGGLEVAKLAQMDGEDSGKVLSEMVEFRITPTPGSGYDYAYAYATSDELAEAGEKYYYDHSDYGQAQMYALMEESGGSVIWAFTSDGGYATAQQVSSWNDIQGFHQVRAVDEMPDVEALKDVVKDLGGEHMVLYNRTADNGLVALYTIGEGIYGEINYYHPDGTDVLARQDRVYFSQGDVSTILGAIQVGAAQGADGVKSYLNSSTYSSFLTYITDSAYILYYE